MRFFTVLITLAAASLAFAPLGASDHCESWESSDPELDTVQYGATYYVDVDTGIDELGSIWVYEESNGHEGLQRGDEVYDDTCHGQIEADTIIF